MLRRHQDSLSARLEQLAAKGWVWIESYELRSWYEMERIGKSVWRDIRDQYDEITSQEGAKISVVENESGFQLFDSRKLVKISEKLGV